MLDHDDTDQEVDNELLSLSNPKSGKGEGVGVGAAHGSCCLWLLVPGHAIDDTQSQSWCAMSQ